jgi:hypothetical protein
MPVSYVLTVTEQPDGVVMTPEDLAQYIRLRLESQNMLVVDSITGIKSE